MLHGVYYLKDWGGQVGSVYHTCVRSRLKRCCGVDGLCGSVVGMGATRHAGTFRTRHYTLAAAQLHSTVAHTPSIRT